VSKVKPKIKYSIVVLLFICGILIGIIGGTLFAVTHDLPQIRDLENFQPSSVTKIYSADNVLLAELFIEKREPVPFARIPLYLKQATIATEDRAFYEHSGVYLKSIFRAVLKNIWAGKYVEGASTITQQLAKTLFLTPQKTVVRKIKEAFLSFQLERRYTKDEILELYLNQIYFGSGAYGVASAARIFFGKNLMDLNLAECALIAGMGPAPTQFSPLINPGLAIKRRGIVLVQMKSIGFITDEMFEQAMKEPLVLDKPEKSLVAPYFVEYTKAILEDTFGPSQLYKGGLSIVTTLSSQLQQAAELSIKKGLLELEKRMRLKQLNPKEPQCALISLDIHTGGILAMVGGRHFASSSFNRAVSARRQPGSAFKPIVYALAIEKDFSQNKIILDAPVVYKGATPKEEWQPENFSNHFEGEMTLRQALVLSKNIPAVRLLEMLGPASAVQFGKALGITTPLLPNLSLALGSFEVTLIELTSAYAIFANKGKKVEVNSVVEVVDSRGRSLWKIKPQQKAVMSEASAAIVTDMLQGVINEGTGSKALVLNRPVAGKTGTTNDFKDALFMGYSPSIATGVWVGQDRYQSLGDGETGASAALPIWIDFMSAVLTNTPYEDFDIPNDVVQVPIDPLTGYRVSDDMPSRVNALFKKGTEPR